MAWLKKRAWKLGLVGLVLAPVGCLGSRDVGPTPLVKPVTTAGPRAGELPTNQAVQVALSIGQAAEKAGNDDTALEEYEKVRALDKDNLQAARRLAVLYDKRAEFSKADAEYRKVAKAKPRDADTYNDWGYSCYLRHNSAEAEKQLRHALILDPNHVRARCNLGLVLGQQERYAEALQAFRDAHLSEAEAHCDLAFVYLTKGKIDDARREARSAGKLDPSCAKAKEVLAKLDAGPSSDSNVKMASSKETRPTRGHGSRPSREELKAQAEAAVAAGPLKDPSPSTPTATAPTIATPTNTVTPVVYQSPNGTKWIPVSRSQAPPPPPPPSDGAVVGTVTFE